MTRFERWSVWITSLLMVFTGTGYLWTKYLVHTDDPWAAVNHPLEPWFLKGHVVVAPFFMFALGVIALRHVWRHLRTGDRRGYGSGMWVMTVVAPMVLTGYLIQVVTHPAWLRALALSHIGLGFLFIAGLGAHQWSVGRSALVDSAREETVSSSREISPGPEANGDRETPQGARPAFSRRP